MARHATPSHATPLHASLRHATPLHGSGGTHRHVDELLTLARQQLRLLVELHLDLVEVVVIVVASAAAATCAIFVVAGPLIIGGGVWVLTKLVCVAPREVGQQPALRRVDCHAVQLLELLHVEYGEVPVCWCCWWWWSWWWCDDDDVAGSTGCG
jgi:hypothetical protein